MGIYIVELLCENASEHHPWIKAPLYKGTPPSLWNAQNL